MTEPEEPQPQPDDDDPDHVLSVDDWVQTEQLREQHRPADDG